MTPENLQALANYIGEILTSFEHAYTRHARGESEQSLLIQFDIWAAGNPLNLSKDRLKAHRAALKSGVEAVDAGVPFIAARARMKIELADLVAEHINDTNPLTDIQPED